MVLVSESSSPLLPRMIVPSLVEIDPVVLKKIFKLGKDIFTILL